MGSLNRVQLIGRLGKDPETRRTGGGDPVVSFSIATSETWNDKATGDRKERTEWHNVVIFNEHLGKVAEQYLKKGHQALVEGQMQTRKWQDQSGQDRYTTEVVLQRFGGQLVLLEKAERAPPDSDSYGQTRSRGEGGNGYAAAKGRNPASPGPSGAGSFAADLDDDIPF